MIDDNDLGYEGQDSPDTEYIIDSINKADDSIVYGLHTQLSTLINFYNRIQNSYKWLTGFWLVAIFIAMGYLFSQEGQSIPFHPMLILFCMSILSMCGIALIWLLDIAIYQTYFYSTLVEQVQFEKLFDLVPRTSSCILDLHTNKKTKLVQTWFYAGCYSCLLILMWFSTLHWVDYQLLPAIYLAIGFIFIIIMVFWIGIILEFPKENPIMKRFREELRKK